MKPLDFEKWERNTNEIPKAYFDEMQSQVLKKIELAQKASPAIKPQKKQPLYWLSAACAVLILGIYAVFQIGKTDGTNIKEITPKHIVKNTKTPKTKATDISLPKEIQTELATIVNENVMPKQNTLITENTIKKADTKTSHLDTTIKENNRLLTPATETIASTIDAPIDHLLTTYSDEEIELLKDEFNDNLFSISE